mmetsp:Transcript_15149/g.37131  ORF Transcript_15149/g.37131 Transcript_15149/m.37131 type:complete len:86 (-) Transcript_15149:156-413(-)
MPSTTKREGPHHILFNKHDRLNRLILSESRSSQTIKLPSMSSSEFKTITSQVAKLGSVCDPLHSVSQASSWVEMRDKIAEDRRDY